MAKKKFLIFFFLLLDITRIRTDLLHQMPVDIQKFAAEKHLPHDGFTSFHIALPLQKDATGHMSPFHSKTLKTKSNEDLILHLPFEKETMILQLQTGFSVLHSTTSVSLASGDKEEMISKGPFPNCYISGHVVSHDGIASFSHCGDGLEGALTANKSEFVINVLPLNLADRHKRSVEDQPYLLAKRSANYNLHYTNLKGKVDKLDEDIKLRSKREAENVTNLIVEIAVYTDAGLTQSLEMENSMFTMQRKIDFIVTKYNGVQYEFWKYDELGGYNITLQLKKIVFFTKDPMTKYRDDSMDAVLEAFCAWQQPRLPFDHVMLLSSKAVEKPGGRAYRPGVCKPEFRCAVSTIVKWGFWYIETHELGHNLGMDHNDNTECREDPTEKQGLMGKRRTGWSSCSTRAFKELISSHGAQCLFEENIRLEMMDPNTIGIVLNGYLPGMYLSPDETCEARHGLGYRYRFYPDLGPCMYHSCTYMMNGLKYGTMKVHRYGMAGLYCGYHKICLLSLKCVDINTLNFKAPIKIQAGGWSSWGPWSDCVPSCGKGIRYREHFCTNPKPINSPECSGYRYTSVPCEGKPCEPTTMDSVTIVQRKINKLCEDLLKQERISNKYVSEGELFGIDEFSVCEFSCYPRSLSNYDRFDRFGLLPDGMPCQVLSKVPKPTKYKTQSLCIKGSCQEIGCDGDISGKRLDVCGVCGGNGSSCVRINGVKELQPQQDVIANVLEIPAFASNIVIQFNFTNEEEAFLMLWSKDDIAILDPHLNTTKTLENPVQFAKAHWDYDSKWFLVSDGPIGQPIKIKVMVGGNTTSRSLIYNYSLPIVPVQNNCPTHCYNNGRLSNCSCLCSNNTGGPDCRDCSTICLNGGEVDNKTCTCKCPSNRMQLPRCECKKKYRGQNCSQCQFTQCRPCGKFDWEKCQCLCQPGFGGRNCDRLCKDKLGEECLQKANERKCETDFEFMAENCEATCKICIVAETSSSLSSCGLDISINSYQKEPNSDKLKDVIFFEDQPDFILTTRSFSHQQKKCSKHELPCDDKTCVPFENVCDGQKHCQDGFDENKKACVALKMAGGCNNCSQLFVICISVVLSSIGLFLN